MELKQELVDSTTYFRYITRRYCLRWAFPHIFQRVSRLNSDFYRLRPPDAFVEWLESRVNEHLSVKERR